MGNSLKKDIKIEKQTQDIKDNVKAYDGYKGKLNDFQSIGLYLTENPIAYAAFVAHDEFRDWLFKQIGNDQTIKER